MRFISIDAEIIAMELNVNYFIDVSRFLNEMVGIIII